MFVRWISRLYVTPEADDTQQTAWSAVLVESRRVNGKPRQRHIAYLGGINDVGIRHLGSRCEFVIRSRAKTANASRPQSRRRYDVQPQNSREPSPENERGGSESARLLKKPCGLGVETCQGSSGCWTSLNALRVTTSPPWPHLPNTGSHLGAKFLQLSQFAATSPALFARIRLLD